MYEILVVCTGNVCRSPMGEVVLRSALEERGVAGAFRVHSAGTGVYGPSYGGRFRGYPASEGAAGAMRRRGFSLSGHRSKRVVPELLEDSALVIAMAREHLSDMLNLYPPVAGKAFLLKEMADLIAGGPLPEAEFSALVTELHARRESPWEAVNRGWEIDVDDPIGGDFVHYERCAEEIIEALEIVADGFWPLGAAGAGPGDENEEEDGDSMPVRAEEA